MSVNDLPNVADPGNGGTPTPAAADPVTTPGTTAGETETPEQRIAAAESKAAEADRKFQELLRMKDNAEETARENERLRAQIPPPTAGAQEVAQYQAMIQQAQVELQQAAAGGDKVAAYLLAVGGAVQALPGETRQRIDLLEVPVDERADVEKIQKDAWDRGERISPKTAKELLQARRLSAQAQQVAKREAELKAAQEAKDRGVVQSRTVGVPASELRTEKMTYSDFARRMENATPAEKDELIKKTRGGSDLVPG